MTSILSQFAILLGLTAINAFFSGAEIAILSVRKSRLRELADAGSRRARSALALRDKPEQFLATVQVGITVVGASAGAFGGVVLEQPVANALRSVGAGAWADRLALAVVVALVSALSIVLGELVPKSLALRSSDRFALLAAPVLLLLSRLAAPVVAILTAASNLFLRPFHDRTNFVESRLSREELRQLVEEAADTGSLDAQAGEMATRAIDLGDLAVGAVMVPRGAIASLEVGASQEEVRALLRDRPYSRYPLTDGASENVLGYVMARDLYTQLLDGRLDLRAALRQVPYFPEQTRAVEVLRTLQTSRTHIGVVVDELGSVAGLVSVEDLAEEVIGEIFAEHETPSGVVQPDGPNTYLVLGTAPVHEINRELGTDLPTGPGFSTLAGLILNQERAIPMAGARISMPGGVEVEVVEATSQRIRRVRLRMPGAPAEPGSPLLRCL
ncbi:MAG: hemolysin family protein [Deltaproteobacteria bacterium]